MINPVDLKGIEDGTYADVYQAGLPFHGVLKSGTDVIFGATF
ncbi:hypothetical protein [Acetobacterium sp.]